MKKYLLFTAMVAWSLSSFSQKITPDVEKKAAALLAQMTLEEKLDYIGGVKGFYIRAIPRLNLPEIRMSDGPQGVRDKAVKSISYPCGVLSASTWNRALVHRLGESIGQDCRARGIHFILGPGVNIYRMPLAGRSFEYFGEDPYLAGETAREYILGVQSRGVAACVKHYAANNQEWDRHHISSDIDERTLQEIYLPAFKKAVQQADVASVMDSYNLINGVHATENSHLNIDILRNAWGFKGILMSDWGAVHSGIGVANGGMDLEMPSGALMSPEVMKKALENGLVEQKTIDLKVLHILQTLIAFGFTDRPQKDSTIVLDNPSSNATALQLAREGVVLLKNEGNILPLKKGTVVVMGENARLAAQGGGSGYVHPYHTVSLLQGMQKNGGVKLIDLSAYRSDSINYEAIGSKIRKAGTVIVAVGFNENLEKEGSDRPFDLPASQNEMISNLAGYNKNIVVVINAGGGVNMQPWLAKVRGVVMAWYTGQNGGTALAEILTGKISPSGKLPISIERQLSDNPSFASYYDKINKRPTRVQYAEGVFCGYRGYEKNHIKPLFPFGFGLSYSSFDYSGLQVEKAGVSTVNVAFTLKNSGKRDAAEVAEVYVREVNSKVVRPLKELKGYEKVFLKKGQSQKVTLVLNEEAFSYFDTGLNKFVADPGQFEILIGSSSEDIRLRKTVDL